MFCISDDVEIKKGRIYGGWREQINNWQNESGSIHNDEVAHQIGMRGGTIPGTIHLNLFPPLFQKIFGDSWFENGSISMYYTFATTHKEKVRAVISLPNNLNILTKNTQFDAIVERFDGKVVAKGTVSQGKVDELSYLRSIELKNSNPDELRILKGLNAGDKMPKRDVMTSKQKNLEDLKNNRDPISYFIEESPWGNSILYPSAMYTLLQNFPKIPEGRTIKAVGFFGATEISNINGPVQVDVSYDLSGEIICVGQSPKTEYIWYDSFLTEKKSDNIIASMRKMTRFMKNSSPLYK